ncbi:MAG: 2-succinyl-5-enolpyruvyl-6-hydroxy-3-cyclohexene-1-carboxylic-acid synthase [Clostridia bacterium]|nr:2-succinyl-5-enolpyruvyl-6-hydroxy-3-cyclohexene-1-carboxylic-acid synthase [Clostridia bacterium]
MYSNLKSVQYLVAMLKENKIKNIVVSPGNSHNAIVRSIEEDRFFKTFNIVDERSAAFFACGIIQQSNEPVAIICTAGTAATNYLTGVTEASRRRLPLIVITADKNPYYLAQQEDQMIDQINLFKTVIKYSVSLPIVKDEKDEWYCKRLLNEAFLELNHHGTGPVHINVPIEIGMFAIGNDFTTERLPSINKIDRYDIRTDEIVLEEKFNKLKGKKVLIMYGQDNFISEERIKKIETITKRYNCIISTDKLSNIHCAGCIETSRAHIIAKESGKFSELLPDVVITIAGNVAWDGKGSLKGYSKNFEHWIVNSDGRVQDCYKNLTTIFEMSTDDFIDVMSKYNVDNSNGYFDLWKGKTDNFNMPELEYSNLYATKQLMERIPANTILNLGNSTTIRIAQYFDLDKSVEVFCNRGVNGIDGCVSTFIGQSAVTDKLSFLIVGDLTFFYDMNALWNRYIGKNVRIMLVNNEGASLFHFNQGLQKYPTLNENVAAEHFTTAKGWVESQGIKYLSANSKEEFDKNVEEFIKSDSDKPVFFEVFTHKEVDAKLQKDFFEANMNSADKIKKGVKSTIKKVMGR